MPSHPSVPDVDLDSSTQSTILRYVLQPAWFVTAALVVPFVLALLVAPGVSIPLSLQVVPLLASVLVLGLPHGAVDHLAVPRVRGQAPTLRRINYVGLLYLVLGGLYAAVWFLTPTLAFVGFILLTWFHWGQGDLYSLLAFTPGDYLDSRLQRGLAVVIRGGLPMLVPLLAFPDWYRRVGLALVSLFDLGSLAPLDPLFHLQTRLALGVGFGLVVVGYLALGYVRTGTHSAWLLDAGETLGLAVYFLVVPPILAIGVYFCVWHSLRHIARLALLDEQSRSAVKMGRLWPAARRFALDATPLTLAAVAILGGFYLLVPDPPGDAVGLVALYLVLLAVLTLPHVVVVSVMDREQAVW